MLYYFKTLPRTDLCQLLPKHKNQNKTAQMFLCVTFLYPDDRPNEENPQETNKKNPKHGLDYITFVSLGCGAKHGKAYTEAMYTLNIQLRNRSS